MPETTNYVTQINVDGTICEIKDSVARTDADSAKSTADTAVKNASAAKTAADSASTKATSALNKVTKLEKLPRVTVTYSSADTTIKVVTTNTHATT